MRIKTLQEVSETFEIVLENEQRSITGGLTFYGLDGFLHNVSNSGYGIYTVTGFTDDNNAATIGGGSITAYDSSSNGYVLTSSGYNFYNTVNDDFVFLGSTGTSGEHVYFSSALNGYVVVTYTNNEWETGLGTGLVVTGTNISSHIANQVFDPITGGYYAMGGGINGFNNTDGVIGGYFCDGDLNTPEGVVEFLDPYTGLIRTVSTTGDSNGSLTMIGFYGGHPKYYDSTTGLTFFITGAAVETGTPGTYYDRVTGGYYNA